MSDPCWSAFNAKYPYAGTAVTAVWTFPGSGTLIPPSDIYADSVASVSMNGNVAGAYDEVDHPTGTAYIGHGGGTPASLGPGIAYDINNAGDAVGYTQDTTSPFALHTVEWIGGAPTGLDFSQARWIGDNGAITGSNTVGGVSHMWLRQPDGTEVDLGVAPQGLYVGRPNALGQIPIGSSSPSQAGTQGGVWEDGAFVPMNDFLPAGTTGWTLNNAYDINDNGDILGWGTHNGQTTGFLLLAPKPTLSISGPTAIEPDAGQTGEADFTVSLSQASPSPVSVTVSTADGTAKAGVAYKQTTQTLTFPANSTAPLTFKVPLIGGAFSAGKETFEANLSDPIGATIQTASADATLVAVSVTDIRQPCNSAPCPGLSNGAAGGGTSISVIGQGFTDAQSVEFVPQDGAPAVTVPAHAVSDTRIDLTTPDLSSAVASLASGHPADTNLAVDVVVEVSDGATGLVESAKNPSDVFNFDIPVVETVSPAKGIAGGGLTLTVSGKYFTGADEISLIAPDSSVANIPLPSGAVAGDTSIALALPDLTATDLAHALAQTVPSASNPDPQPLPLDVAVLVPATDKPPADALTSLPALKAFTVEPFAITSVSPTDVPVAPATASTVTIHGVGFVDATDAASGGSGGQQVVFQPQPSGLGFCYASQTFGYCTATPTIVSDSTMTVAVPSYLRSSWFTQGSGAPLPLDVRLKATIGGASALTPLVGSDVLTVHLPAVSGVTTPPVCRPGAIVTLVGDYLDGPRTSS